MRRPIKYSERWEGFRPPADGAAFALRTGLADESKEERRAPRWMLSFALCFAIGVWLAVLFMTAEPTQQFVRWSETTITHRPAKTIVRTKPSAPVKSSAMARKNCGAAQPPNEIPCEAPRFRSSVR